jgi:hypothetical protein
MVNKGKPHHSFVYTLYLYIRSGLNYMAIEDGPEC